MSDTDDRGAAIERRLAEIDEEKARLRDESRELLAELASDDADEFGLIQAYWYQRLLDDPEDPDALTAKGAIIRRQRGEASDGITVTADPAPLAARAGEG